MILTVTPNPCVDKTVYIDHFNRGDRKRASRCSFTAGGKGVNVSRAAKRLGGETEAIVLVGGHPGRHVVDMMERDDEVVCRPVWTQGMTRTITTVLEEDSGVQTAFFEPGPEVAPGEAQALLALFLSRIGEAKVLTLNGTVPCDSLVTVYAQMIGAARDAGIPVILDSHGAPFIGGLAARPYMIKPNVAEAEPIVGFPLDSLAARWKAVDYFHDQGVKLVVLSMGEQGALISDGENQLQAIPPSVKEVNAVGSGDALVAGFAMGLAKGWNLDHMTRAGMAAGTANAAHWGIEDFTLAEVEALSVEVNISAR